MMQAMKMPKNYEPKNADEFGTFDAAMTRILAVPASDIKGQIAADRKKKARKKRAKKSSERGVSRDFRGEV